MDEIYRRMSTFPLATLEKFTLQTQAPANVHEEAKILEAAAKIRAYNTSTKVIFYHMAWQNFPQFDLYNLTQEHVEDHWTVTWDNGAAPRPGISAALSLADRFFLQVPSPATTITPAPTG